MGTALLEPSATNDAPRTKKPILSAGPTTNDQEGHWKEFLSLPWPTRTDEAWRFANVKDLDLTSSEVAEPVCIKMREEILDRSIGLESIAGQMIFANDQLIAQKFASTELQQKGVIWLPISQAAIEHPELFQKHFMREEAILGGQKFAALHASQMRAGTFLYIPRGVEIALPIEAFHWLEGANSSVFPHTLIIAEEMSKVTLIDYYESADQEMPGLACGVNDLRLANGASVTYVCVQNWSPLVQTFQINSTVVGRDAQAKSLFAQLGGRHVRTESVSHLRGQGGRSVMLAVAVGTSAQEIDSRTLQVHEVPNTTSDLLYKNSLDDNARTIFAGLIRVLPGAHQTDAYQKVRNLMLSDAAEANSAPGLEIEADDVRCTHGATSGQIEQEELFYLLSRGICRQRAQRLIVFGFLNEVLERLENEPIQSKLRTLLEAKFSQEEKLSTA